MPGTLITVYNLVAGGVLLWFGAEYPTNFMGFGFPRRHDSYNNYLVRDGETGELDIWAPNRWSHTCFAYDHRTTHVRLVQVCSIWYTPSLGT